MREDTAIALKYASSSAAALIGVFRKTGDMARSVFIWLKRFSK